MTEETKAEFKRRKDTDFAYEIPNVARLRANVFIDRNGMGGSFRLIPTKIISASELGLEPAILEFCEAPKGLILVTGPTGSGKSTTLAAMIHHINSNRQIHIITIEDPIEFLHQSRESLVTQREIHSHTQSFAAALRAALREDPDVILVGEMRDLETTHLAIEAAETGHLVFATLHTNTAASTVDRAIDQFPGDQQSQIRTMLAASLRGVVSQTLLKRRDGNGRVAAREILVATRGVQSLVREGKTFQIESAIETGGALGMQLLNDSILLHVKRGAVSLEEALLKALDKEDLKHKHEDWRQSIRRPPAKPPAPAPQAEQTAAGPAIPDLKPKP